MGGRKSYSNLAVMREYKGMSELKLATEVKCEEKDIVAIENGGDFPNSVVKRIAQYFSCGEELIKATTGERGKEVLLEKLAQRDTLRVLLMEKAGIDLDKHGGHTKADAFFGYENKRFDKIMSLKHLLDCNEIDLICEKLGISSLALGQQEQMEIQEATEDGCVVIPIKPAKEESLSESISYLIMCDDGFIDGDETRLFLCFNVSSDFFTPGALDKLSWDTFKTLCSLTGEKPEERIARFIEKDIEGFKNSRREV